MMSFQSYRSLVVFTAFAFLSIPVRAFDWPQWRGPDRTDVSVETGLMREWPEGGPRQVWRFDDAGLGYSGPAIAGGKIFIMGARGSGELLICLEEATGNELWATPIGEVYEKRAWGGGPRGTPTVDGDRVYAMGGQGVLICARVADGEKLWSRSMEELGGSVPEWGYTESVLVDGGKVLCTPGGEKGTVAALDKMSGEVLWQSSGLTDRADYASIVVAEFHGQKQYVQLTQKTLAGISAVDGKVAWRVEWPGRTAVIPTPIVSGNHVYVTAGYGVGCMLVRIDAGNEPVEMYRNRVMKNHHGGVVLVGQHLYGYSEGMGWTCQDFLTGEEVWAERDALGKGAVTCADGMLYCLEERRGTVALVRASPEGWKEAGRFNLSPLSERKAPQGQVWTHPVISNGKLYLRDQEHFFCFSVAAEPAS